MTEHLTESGHFQGKSIEDLREKPSQVAVAWKDRVYYDEKACVVVVHRYPDGTPYEIGRDALTSPAGVVQWLFHLKRKPWCSPELLWSFFETVELKIGLRLSEERTPPVPGAPGASEPPPS